LSANGKAVFALARFGRAMHGQPDRRTKPLDRPAPHTTGLRARLARMFPPGTAFGGRLRRVGAVVLDSAAHMRAALQLPLDAMHLRTAWSAGHVGIGRRAEGRRIIMLVVSDLRSDPRVRREARELADAGYSVTIIWPDTGPEQGEQINWGAGIAFVPLPVSAGRFAYHFPNFLGVDMLKAAVQQKAAGQRILAFHAHDLTTMLVALIAGRQTGAHVVADHHEWFSQSVVWANRRSLYVPIGPVRRWLYRWLEALVLKHASVTLTVCDSIAQEMAEKSTRKVAVVRNIPGHEEAHRRAMPDLRADLGIATHQQLIAYQGGIGPSRALEPAIQALAYAPGSCLMIRGPNLDAYADHYRAVAVQAGVSERLFLLPPVASQDVVAALYGADVGLYTVEGFCKSAIYALPNKVFEYLHAGLPVLTVDYPEVRKLLVDNQVGLGFAGSDPESIGRAMREMGEPGRRSALAATIPAVLAANHTDAEWQKLVALYDALPRSGS
jgi:glycosyltransferase involved in cell wall biosynthesis